MCALTFTNGEFFSYAEFHDSFIWWFAAHKRGPQWPSWLAGLASNHRLSPLCRFNSHR